MWAAAAARRNDMQGLDSTAGIDRKATLALYASKLPHAELGLLRGVLAGCIRLQKRLFDAKLVASPLCPFCGLCDETLQHCFWDCPKWDHIRTQFDLPLASTRASWFTCTRDCGLFLEDPCVVALPQQLEQEELETQDLDSKFACTECWNSVVALQDVHVKQKIWTDGAASHNQDYCFRRAGCGIFYGNDNNMNLSTIVPGRQQGNQRAELLAVLLSCLRDPRPLDIRSDSEYVCKGFASWKLWCDSGWKHDHADLWNRLAKHQQSRATEVSVTWVKGHAKAIDVARGRTTDEDKRGNDGADKLAVAGAAMHQVSAEVVAAASLRKTNALHVQQMMVAILKARFLAESLARNDAECPDRGSEMGDCIETLPDNEPASNNEDCTEFQNLDDDFDLGANILT